MDGIVTPLKAQEKRKLKKCIQSCHDANLRVRYLVIYNLDNHFSPTEVSRMAGVVLPRKVSSGCHAPRLREHAFRQGAETIRDSCQKNK